MARGFRDLPFMGVIHVNNEAAKAGYVMGDPAWSNLGQGQPEVGPIEGAPPRIDRIDLAPSDHAYGPVEGLPELRRAVADHYNRLYRMGQSSKYGPENVAIAAGGRLALTRLAASLDRARLGYFTPDYTAYEDMLSAFPRIEPVHWALSPESGFRIAPGDLDGWITREKLRSVLVSNPCNPTGVVVQGEELSAWVEAGRRRDCAMLFDEFYSHFVYAGRAPNPRRGAEAGVSAAEFVRDVDEDPIVIVDGLTKCFRYPGWRVGWVLGPRQVIRTLTAAGSFVDGGPGRPIQRAALAALEPARADQEVRALRRVFSEKHRNTLTALSRMGVVFPGRPEGTFYAWGSVAKLTPPLDTGEGFMRRGFEHRVLSIPGEYFDVNPGRARAGPSPLSSFVRFSFGPPRDNLEAGLERLGKMVADARQ